MDDLIKMLRILMRQPGIDELRSYGVLDRTIRINDLIQVTPCPREYLPPETKPPTEGGLLLLQTTVARLKNRLIKENLIAPHDAGSPKYFPAAKPAGKGIDSSYIAKVLIDDEEAIPEDIAKEIKKIAIGGYLFNAEIDDNSIELSIATMQEGHKNMYYQDTMFKGVVYPDGINFGLKYTTIANRAGKDAITIASLLMDLNKRKYDLCVRLARFFLEHGFPPRFKLYEPMRKDLENMRIFKTVPDTIGELAAQPLSTESDYDVKTETLNAAEEIMRQIILHKTLTAIAAAA